MYVIGRCDTLDFLWQFPEIYLFHEKMPSLSTWTLENNNKFINKIIKKKAALAYFQVFNEKNIQEIMTYDMYRNLSESRTYSILAQEIDQLLSHGFKAYVSKQNSIKTFIGQDGCIMLVLEVVLFNQE